MNSWPGWESIPYLTDAAASVLWLVNLSLSLGLLAQMACAVDDTARVRALGVYCVALVNMALIASLLQVFPFDFGDVDPAWTTATRLVLSPAAGVGRASGRCARRSAWRTAVSRSGSRRATPRPRPVAPRLSECPS